MGALRILALSSALASLVVCYARAAEFSEEQIAEATRKREAVVKGLKEELATCERDWRSAIKDKDRDRTKLLHERLKKLREELPLAQARSIEEYAAEIAVAKERAAEMERQALAERQAAAHRAEEARKLAIGKEAAEKLEAEKRAAAEREAAIAEEKREQERFEKSGGCPLKVWGTDFDVIDVDSVRRGARLAGRRDSMPANLFGECIFVSCTVENCVKQRVDAYELRIQFINGFDEVIKEEVLQGTTIRPAEEVEIRNGWPKVATTVKVRVLIERTKLNDGQVWRREPNHQFVSDTAK
jgi:hypothetical protein